MSPKTDPPTRIDSPTPAEGIALSANDRVLLLAAHPDDESVGTGGLLQAALAVGAAVRVCYLTDGENNPWAQRASERRFRAPASARQAFGARRRREALAALEELGVPGDDAVFLGFPDQGLTGLLVGGDTSIVEALVQVVKVWRPTLLLAPSCADLHPDHSALAVLADLALARPEATVSPERRWAYVVHNPSLRAQEGVQAALPLPPALRRRKLAAILHHATQLPLRGRWLRSFAGEDEPYLKPGWPPAASHPVTSARVSEVGLELVMVSRSQWRSFGRRRLHLLALPPAGELVSLVVSLPSRSSRPAVKDTSSRRVVGAAVLTGTPRQGRLVLSGSIVPEGSLLYAKMEHRFGFFDEAGWREFKAIS